MAIYRCEIKNISRGQGRSCVAAAAYRHRTSLHDQRQELDHAYTHKGDVELSEIVAPENAPEWVHDRERLWNAADAAEKRKDARTAKEVLVALPRELNTAEQAGLVREFARAEFASKGLVADIAIHAPRAQDGETQPHAHIMLTTRPLENGSFAKGKDYSLDKPPGIEAIREQWATHCNRALERARSLERVDHRSLADQRQAALAAAENPAQPEPDRIRAAARAMELDRAPEPKIGPVAMQMARQGRGARAHALRDAMQVRQDRSLLRTMSRSWEQVRQAGANLMQTMRERLPGLASVLRQALPLPSALIAATATPDMQRATQMLDMRAAEKILKTREHENQQRQQQHTPDRGRERGRGIEM